MHTLRIEEKNSTCFDYCLHPFSGYIILKDKHTIIIIIIIIIISFMQCIYKDIPETNHVPREYSVSAILSLLFMVPISLVPALVLLYFYVSTFRIICAVPNMEVFRSSFTSRIPCMLLTYFLNDFEMVPVAPMMMMMIIIIIGILSMYLINFWVAQSV